MRTAHVFRKVKLHLTRRCSTVPLRYTGQVLSRIFVVLLRKSIPQKYNLKPAAELNVRQLEMNKFCIFALLLFITTTIEAKNVESKEASWSKSCIPTNFKNEIPYSESLAALAEHAHDLFPSIKAEYIKQEIPEYELFHIDDVLNKKVTHDIQVYISRNVDIEELLEEQSKLWNIYGLGRPVLVEKEKETSFWRVYLASEPKPFWYLVKSEPLKNPAKEVPNDWFIGKCSEQTTGHLCTIRVAKEKYEYSYSIVGSEISKLEKISIYVNRSVESIVESCSK